MKVTRSWLVGEGGVNALQRLCLDQGWVLQITPGQTDFGKDAYLDLAIDGQLTGHCVAIQVKGGHSRTAAGWIRIDAAARHREYWRSSSVPVFGIAWDDETNDLLWVDLTAELLSNETATLRALRSHDLREDPAAFAEYVAGVAVSPPWGLVESEPRRQRSAVSDCWALGHTDVRALRLLRKSMFGLADDALAYTIWLFSRFSLHPDKWRSSESIEQDRRRAGIIGDLEWTSIEVMQMLAMAARVDPEGGIGRGTIGQDIVCLIGMQLDRNSLVEDAILVANAVREFDAAWLLLILRLSNAMAMKRPARSSNMQSKLSLS